MRTKSKWSPGPGIKVQSVVSNGDGDWVVSACGPSSGICPDCRHQSRSRHGWSYRSLKDLPVQGNKVMVRLRMSRWRCTYRQCNRQTFIDPAPAIASPYARRTTRVAEIAGLLGHSTGGRPGERLMRRPGMPISDDTILRHLKRNASQVDDEPWHGSSVSMTGVGGNRGATARSSLISNAERSWTFSKTGACRALHNG